MIAVQPPAYFPPLAYTALMYHVDHFVLADTFRFRRKTFQNRSKLRNAQGSHWIRIPLFGRPEGGRIHAVDIETGGRWREKHWRSFLYDYRSTMYFEYFADTLRPFFDVEWTTLADCTGRSVELQAELFGISTPITRAQELDGAPSTLEGIVRAAQADTVAVPAGQEVPDALDATVHRIGYDHPTYRQNFEGFEPGMTALDLLFNYGREAPRRMAGGLASTAA
jgi:hypothetical protein